MARRLLFRFATNIRLLNRSHDMREREKNSRFIEAVQKQTVRHGTLCCFPKFSIPPVLLILREVKLLEMSERFDQLSGLHQTIPQQQRD
jgi:hypothetical protein